MKNILIMLCSFLISCNCAISYTNYYNPTYTYKNTYSPYKSPLGYSRYQNKINTRKAIRKIQQKRKLNRAKRLYNNINSIFNNNQGALTGYSVPINQNIFSRFAPNDISGKHKINSPLCNQDIFSDGSGNEIHYDNGEYYKNFQNTDAKTGITIIYD